MRIICIEEHAVDQTITRAVQQAQATEAGYMNAWNSRADDIPVDNTRPRQVSGRVAFSLAADLGAGRLAAMDLHGVDMQILSYSNVFQLAEPKEALTLTRAANDRLAAAVRAHPTRFRAFAMLPLQIPEAAAEELERMVTEHGFIGAVIQGRPGPNFLDDSRYACVLAKLNPLEVPLFVHPGLPLPQVQQPYYGNLDPEISARLSLFGWGWHNEAGVHVLRLMLSGVFERYPRLQLISGHWGEMVPFFLQRLDDTMPLAATGFSRSLTEIYRQHVYVHPSGMMSLPHFEFTYNVLGASRILYSVDYPYVTLDGSRDFLESLPLSQHEKEQIAFLNAESLFRF